jgi:hypothetical protein
VLEKVAPQATSWNVDAASVPNGGLPGRYRDLDLCASQNRLDGRLEIRVGREHDADVEALVERRQHEVDGQLNVDAFLGWLLDGVALRVPEGPSEDLYAGKTLPRRNLA